MYKFIIPLDQIANETYAQWLQLMAEGITTKSLHLLNILFGSSYTSTNINISAEIDPFKGVMMFTLKRNSTSWSGVVPKGSIDRVQVKTKTKNKNKEEDIEYKAILKKLENRYAASFKEMFDKFTTAYTEYSGSLSLYHTKVLKELYRKRMQEKKKEIINE